jgi:hypothetical protein
MQQEPQHKRAKEDRTVAIVTGGKKTTQAKRGFVPCPLFVGGHLLNFSEVF